MTDQRKKEIADHFMEAMNREDLHTSQAGRFLNLNPCYLSMIKNSKHWSGMSRGAWDRFEEWHETRDKISAFVIPEGEPIFKKSERKPQIPEEGEAPSNYPTGSAAAAKVTKKEGRKKKEKLSESSTDIIQALDIKVAELTLKYTLILREFNILEEKYQADIDKLKAAMDIMADKTLTLSDKLENQSTTPSPKLNGKRRHSSIIFFQRNYYKP